jgi:type IV pilus assembly protein PilQ
MVWGVVLASIGAGVEAQPAARPRDELVDIDLHRADVRHALELLAEIAGLHLVFGDEVAGQVTLTLRQVRWSDALRVILRAHGLELERHGDILLVTPAQQFADGRTRELEAREQCQQSAPLRTRILRLSHATAAAMAPVVRATLSPRGSVQVDARTNSLIIRDVDCP